MMKSIFWNCLLLCLLMPLSLSAQKGKNDKPGKGPSHKEGIVADTAEHAMLMQLYAQTNGNNWLRKQHWGDGSTQKEMQRWQGFNFSQGDVHQLNMQENNMVGSLPERLGELAGLKHIKLNGNQLKGAVPFSLSRLPELQTLELQNNRFTAFPNFSLSPMLAKLKVNLSNNRLDFGDLEPNFSAPGKPIFKEFTYQEQALLGAPDTLFQRERTRMQLVLQTGGTHNRYQWQKENEAGQWVPVAGATQSTLELYPLQLADSGNYRCQVTNSWVPNLTLYTHAYTVQVEEYAEVPFTINGTAMQSAAYYQLQADTIEAIRPLAETHSFTLINPEDTVVALLSLQDAAGNSLGSGYRFKIDPLGSLSELRYIKGTEVRSLPASLYKIDSSQLQLFPLPQAGYVASPYKLQLERGLRYFPEGSGGEPQPLLISGLPEQASLYSFQLMNSRGELVFSTNELEDFWQGRLSDNSPAAAGTYYYLLSVEGRQTKGQFVLVRN